MSEKTLIVSAVAGVATHLIFFKQGEHFLYPWSYVQAFLTVFVGFLGFEIQFQHIPAKLAVSLTAKLASVYLAGLYSSLVVYRLFFNPLNKFPGPYLTRLSKLYFSYQVGQKSDSHRYLLRLHQKYGKYVRIGPNDLSVIDADGIQVTSGVHSKCIKGPWYDLEHPRSTLHQTRDKAQHDRRRRIWSPAFSEKALRGYENRIRSYVELLLRKIDASIGQPMDASKWFNFYSFDVMGDLAFGKSFEMLESGAMHWAIDLLNKGLHLNAFHFPIWLIRATVAIPGLASDFHRFNDYCSEQIHARAETQGNMDNPDIAHFLIEDIIRSDPKMQEPSRILLEAESKLVIVAGSDTTAATLVHLFYHIASEPGLANRLRADFEPLIDADGQIHHRRIQEATLLNGCINETLRMHPPLPCGVWRQTPKEGVYIGDVYIPGDTVIQMPYHVMGQDESLFPEPQCFIPERFTTKPELIRHKDAFGPFSIGSYSCIGKRLALMEIRLLTVHLLTRFDVALAPGENGHDLLNETVEHLTLGTAPLQLVFTTRK